MLRADELEGMMNLNVLGVYREAEFSPGKVADDAAIIDAALAELERGGADVTAVTAEQFVTTTPRYAGVVLAMCQSHKALNSLASVEKSGAVVMNTALAIRNCYRDLLGASRKFAIALLDYFDHSGVTIRVGDARKLRAKAF